MKMLKKIKIKYNYTYLLLGLLALVLLVFTFTRGYMFWRVDTWLSMARQFPEYGLMVLAVMLCFIIGKIDVSFVALGNFVAITAIMIVTQVVQMGDTSGAVVGIIAIALVMGAFCGLLNGTLIAVLNIPPILATLSTQMVFRGITVGITEGNAVSGLPTAFSQVIRDTTLFGFRIVQPLVFLAVLLLFTFILKCTAYGKTLYMIGSNPVAAKFSAINTTRIVIVTFVIAGVTTTMGTLLMVANMNSARADTGASYLMRVILILVLAGVLPSGGIGKIINVVLSIIIIQIISTGVNMFPNLNTFYRELISAALLLAVLVATSYLLGERKRGKPKLLKVKKETLE